MKVYNRIVISMLLWIIYMIYGNTVEAQESNEFTLSVLEREIAIADQKRSIALHVKIINQSDRKYKLFSFHNQWDALINTDYIPGFVYPGFNVAIFDDDGKIFFPPQGIANSADAYINTFLTKGADSALVAAKKLAAKLERLILENEQRIRDSAQWMSPGGSLETVLEIDLYNHGLIKKGKYYLEVYYVINKKIFKYTEKGDDLFIGYLKSNRIQLIVQ